MAKTTRLTAIDTTGRKTLTGCAKCGPDRSHNFLYSLEEHVIENDFLPESITVYDLVRCEGCAAITVRLTRSNSEDMDPSGEPFETVELYPLRDNGRRPINDNEYLPPQLGAVYLETLKALNSSQPILAGAGIRAIVETVCKAQDVAGSDLFGRIEDLVTKHLLSRTDADSLHKLRVLGNEAAHDVKPHALTTLSFAMDVLDNLLESTYVFPLRAKSLFAKSESDAQP